MSILFSYSPLLLGLLYFSSIFFALSVTLRGSKAQELQSSRAKLLIQPYRRKPTE